MQRLGGHALAQAHYLDVARGFTGNFLVPEQQSGLGAQPGFSTLTPEPGEMRRMAMSSVARGADGLMFFRWRPAHFGAEIYWMGIIDHDDIPRRRYDEARQFAGEINAIKDKILGTHVRMDVGIAGSDFDNQEAHRTYPMGLPSPEDDGLLLYRHCYRKGIACGFIHPDDDLSPLKALYVPHWLSGSRSGPTRIEAFAQKGGIVILGARTATRDGNNQVIRETAPGFGLSALAGVTVDEFGRLAPGMATSYFRLARSAPAVLDVRRSPPKSPPRSYAHLQQPRNHRRPSLRVARAGRRDRSHCCLVQSFHRRQGGDHLEAGWRGAVIYLGAYLTDDLVTHFVPGILSRADVHPLLPDLPEGVEVTVREAADRQLMFILNTREQRIHVRGVPDGLDLLTGTPVESHAVHLGEYGCSIVQVRYAT